jgi:hypothetical protein
VTRRQLLAELLAKSREQNAVTRRLYTNQSMIKDLYGIYYANRGLAVVAPAQAWPEEKARRYLYEAIGLQPWLGSDLADGGSARSVGDAYFQLTAKGLTKELGYVGSYGEVVDWVTKIYEATRSAPDQPGDPRVRAQLVKIALARTPFRYAAGATASIPARSSTARSPRATPPRSTRPGPRAIRGCWPTPAR